MTLLKKGKYWYGDDYSDLRAEIHRFSVGSGYLAVHFAEPTCSCGTNTFHLYMDEDAGAALRVCSTCDTEHCIGDSEEYIEEADLKKSICVCGTEVFQISVGVALYPDSNDVRWLFLGGRCPTCGMLGVYGDWKNEYIGYADLLRKA